MGSEMCIRDRAGTSRESDMDKRVARTAERLAAKRDAAEGGVPADEMLTFDEVQAQFEKAGPAPAEH